MRKTQRPLWSSSFASAKTLTEDCVLWCHCSSSPTTPLSRAEPMSTSRAIWPSRSRWSRFKCTYLLQKTALRFLVDIETRSLSICVLSDARIERLNFLESLPKQGLSARQIADYLNDSGIKTPQGKHYYPELIFVTLAKFRRRNVRAIESKVVVKDIGFES